MQADGQINIKPQTNLKTDQKLSLGSGLDIPSVQAGSLEGPLVQKNNNINQNQSVKAEPKQIVQ